MHKHQHRAYPNRHHTFHFYLHTFQRVNSCSHEECGNCIENTNTKRAIISKYVDNDHDKKQHHIPNEIERSMGMFGWDADI